MFAKLYPHKMLIFLICKIESHYKVKRIGEKKGKKRPIKIVLDPGHDKDISSQVHWFK